MLAKILLVLVILSGLATLGMLFAGLISMARNVDGNLEGGRRSNKLMWWRVRLQFLTIILIGLWWWANQASQG
jgi:H+/Cl- antiporter ClcA